MSISFRVIGEPVPQGSMKGFIRGGRVALTSDNPKLHHWRDVIGWEARQHCTELLTGAVDLTAQFLLTRPKSCPKSRIYPTVKPDADKLARALFDALTGVVWQDDAQVVSHEISKRYCDPGEQPGVYVKVEALP
jgi:Holliday junction resolvase RusA-like endonuclease